jgi:hypothetical protein
MVLSYMENYTDVASHFSQYIDAFIEESPNMY